MKKMLILILSLILLAGLQSCMMTGMLGTGMDMGGMHGAGSKSGEPDVVESIDVDENYSLNFLLHASEELNKTYIEVSLYDNSADMPVENFEAKISLFAVGDSKAARRRMFESPVFTDLRTEAKRFGVNAVSTRYINPGEYLAIVDVNVDESNSAATLKFDFNFLVESETGKSGEFLGMGYWMAGGIMAAAMAAMMLGGL